MPDYLLNASQCPGVVAVATVTDPADGTPTTAATAAAGALGSNANAVRLDLLGRYGGGGRCIATGLDLTSGGGLTLNVSPGVIMCDGPVVKKTAFTPGLRDGAQNYVWFLQTGLVELKADDLTAPTTPGVFLGRVTVAGNVITAIDYSGRLEKRGGHLWRRTNDVGTPNDTPPASVHFFARTAGGVYYWDGVGYQSLGGAGSTPPSGTGFRHVTAGSEDAAAKLVETADVHADLKDAAAGTVSMRTLGTSGVQACAGNDARLSDARTPTSHGDGAHDATVASLTAGLVPTAELGSGTASASNFLRGDQSWAAPASGAPTLIAGNSGAAASGAAPSSTWQILTANATANSTTSVATVMTTTDLPAGTYQFEYFVVWQSATTTVGVNFVVDFTGTVTRFRATRHLQTTGAAAATGVADGVSTTLTGQLVEHYSTRSDAGAMGPNTGVGDINADQFDMIRGILVVSTTGNLLLQHASETATSTQVMADTMLILRRLA